MPKQREEIKEGDADEIDASRAAGPDCPAPAEGSPSQARMGGDPGQNDLVEKRISELEELNGLLKDEISGLKDQYLRKVADFDNFRKRMNKDKEDSVAFANGALLLDLVAVLDDFDRALKAVGPEERESSLFKGVEMTEKQMITLLESKWGLARYSCIGAEFDPNLHEAIGAVQSAEVRVPTVKDEYMKGYTLNGRVIRPAKVFVNMPAQAENAAGAEGAEK